MCVCVCVGMEVTGVVGLWQQPPVRHLNLHEHQSKGLMEQYGIKVQSFRIAESGGEAARLARELSESV